MKLKLKSQLKTGSVSITADGTGMPSTMSMLNVGCGQRFHPDWVNIDFVAPNDKVIACDLRKGIPFSACAFKVVYQSHLLEHFLKSDALFMLKECFRVLEPRGIIRVAVPDLERIVRLYIQALDNIRKGEQDWETLRVVDA